ncbi:MAG: hypothetical protein ACRD4O_11375, partial [Bryobacteraceae bacterium]
SPAAKILAGQIGVAPPSEGSKLLNITDAADANKKIMDKVAMRTSQIIAAYHDLDRRASPNVLREHIEKLEEAKPEMPMSRLLYVVLARLYRWTGDLDKAIAMLTEFIERQKKRERVPDDVDIAMPYWNRACYFAQKAEQLAGQSPNSEEHEKIKKFKDKSLADLRKAIERIPRYKEDIGTDPDLRVIAKEHPELVILAPAIPADASQADAQ